MDEQANPLAESQGVEMLPIATEIFTVTEQNPGEYVSMLNEEFFLQREIQDPNRHLKAMLVLARNKLLLEIGSAERTRTVETAVHRSFRSTVFSTSFLLDDDMNLIFLTYFGEQTPRDTNYAEALVHVLEVLDILENDLGSGTAYPGERFGRRASVASRSVS